MATRAANVAARRGQQTTLCLRKRHTLAAHAGAGEPLVFMPLACCIPIRPAPVASSGLDSFLTTPLLPPAILVKRTPPLAHFHRTAYRDIPLRAPLHRRRRALGYFRCAHVEGPLRIPFRDNRDRISCPACSARIRRCAFDEPYLIPLCPTNA